MRTYMVRWLDGPNVGMMSEIVLKQHPWTWQPGDRGDWCGCEFEIVYLVP